VRREQQRVAGRAVTEAEDTISEQSARSQATPPSDTLSSPPSTVAEHAGGYPYGWKTGCIGYQYISVDRDNISPMAFDAMKDTVLNIVGGDVVQSTPTTGPRSDHYVVNIKRCAFGNLEVGFTSRKTSSTVLGACGPRLYIKGITYNAWEDSVTERLMMILKAAYDIE